jgi:hypothetical protein
MLRALIATLTLVPLAAMLLCPAVAQNDGAGCSPPPQSSASVLGDVSKLLAAGTRIDGAEFTAHPAKQICKLPGGQLYYEVATLNIDDDGSTDGSTQNWEPHPVRGGKLDASHQDGTSYGGMLPKPPGKSDFISAFNEPYIVLPGVHTRWFRNHGLSVGDGAVVIKGDQKIVAVFADVGPDQDIGEMSVKGHELFGFEAFQSGLRAQRDPDGKPLRDPATGKLLTEPATVTVNHAQTGPFVVIVFPQTSAGRKFTSVKDSLEPKINGAFANLAATTTSSTSK